jgi:hypothetical protein
MSVGVMKDSWLQPKTKEFTRLTYTGLVVELEHLKIETRLIDVIEVPSRLRLTRKATTLARIDETRDLSLEEKAARRKWKNAPIFDFSDWTTKGWKKRSVSRWVCKNKILFLPVVLAIADTKVRCPHNFSCLLWIDETKPKDKTYIWVSV